ncbi:FliH/SctL family protein [Granulosicoccaceae sp. 1_MG-2023]|nr:FliH/SctL family protein [Granulosicoccaceae sp. 1_MG-2023]
MNLSKVMRPDASATVTPWQVPPLEQVRSAAPADNISGFTVTDYANSAGPEPEPEPQAEPVKGYEDGYADGLAEGQRRAAVSCEQERAELQALLHALARPLEQVNQAVENELTALALAAAKMILRRELSAQPAHITGLIRDAINSLPASGSVIHVQLNPADAVLVREALSGDTSAQAWQIREDASLQRGQCHVHTESSFVDAGIDALINRLAAEMSGGRRATDQNENIWDEAV